MSGTFNLQARAHQSSVLMGHLARTPGAMQRAGLTVRNDVIRVSSSDNAAMLELFKPVGTASGYAVTDSTAMTVSTVYACLSKIAGAILQLPIHQYRQTRDGRERMEPTPLWWMLNEQPDTAWTAAAWKEWIVRCWGLRGDQFTFILRDTSKSAGGAVTGLRPLHPDQVEVRRLDNRLVYDVAELNTGRWQTVDQDDMLHFTGFGFDGLRSMSAVQWAARNAIANSLASTDYMGRTVGEGAMPQIALSYPNKMGPQQAADLRASFVSTYTGARNRKLPLLLTEGATVAPLSISPVDLQLIDMRRFDKEEICEAIGVPLSIIGDTKSGSGVGTTQEQVSIRFVRDTIRPMTVRWKQELNRKLFRRAGMFVEFNLAALLQGDSKAKAEAFRAALGGPGTGDGWMSVDEIRTLENLPTLGGDAANPYRAQRAPDNPGAPAP